MSQAREASEQEPVVMNQVCEISEALYTSREAFIGLCGEEALRELAEGFKPIFDAVCKKHDCSKLEAAISMIKHAGDDEYKHLQIYAAYTELTEGWKDS